MEGLSRVRRTRAGVLVLIGVLGAVSGGGPGRGLRRPGAGRR
jgi:hypothetical protein